MRRAALTMIALSFAGCPSIPSGIGASDGGATLTLETTPPRIYTLTNFNAVQGGSCPNYPVCVEWSSNPSDAGVQSLSLGLPGQQGTFDLHTTDLNKPFVQVQLFIDNVYNYPGTTIMNFPCGACSGTVTVNLDSNKQTLTATAQGSIPTGEIGCDAGVCENPPAIVQAAGFIQYK